MRLFLTFGFLFILPAAGSGQAQQQPEPQTIAECLSAVEQHPGRQADAARKAGQKIDYRAYNAQAKELAKKYVTRFKVEEVKEADLPALAHLYLQADEVVLARDAINRRLKATNLSERERADALLTAIGIAMSRSPSDESIKLGENLTAQVDALSNAVLRQKISAHSRMASHYAYVDLDDKNLEHHAAMLKLTNELPAGERDSYSSTRGNAYEHIALVHANRGLTDEALKTLRQAKTELGTDGFDFAIERYSLVGKAGAPLKGRHWINAAPETKQVDVQGPVTLIQFTAHWCGPCRKSYPAMLKFHEQFQERGLNVMMATQLYGFFGARQELTPDEEMAANREYYVDHHKLSFKIAVESPLDSAERAAAKGARPDTNNGKYIVGGIPQIVLLDKQGIVRQILIGWDPANEARVTTLIEQLLQEPAKK